jgi:hypothetical protein
VQKKSGSASAQRCCSAVWHNKNVHYTTSVILLFKTVVVKKVETLLSFFPNLSIFIPGLVDRSLKFIIIRSIFLGIHLNLHGLSVDLSQDSAALFPRILLILIEFGQFLSGFGRKSSGFG